MASQDTVIRAMTNDGAFRVIAASTQRSIQEVVDAQESRGRSAQLLGELVTAAALFRETMAPTLRVQCIVNGAGDSGRLIADSHPDGWLRGIIQEPRRDAFRLGEGARIHLMRALPKGALQEGLVELPAGGTISDGIMRVMQQSEQIETVVRLSCVVQGAEVTQAGGYLVQLLPEAPDREEAVELVTSRLEAPLFQDFDSQLKNYDGDPTKLVDVLMEGLPYTLLDSSTLRYGCDCNKVRVLHGLATIDRAEIRDMVEEGHLQIRCESCGKQYRIDVAELRGLLSSA